MSQQQQPTTGPSAPRPPPTGIPSHASQVEGLSVSETLVNDVLVNLQTKMINETVSDHGESTGETYFGKIRQLF